MLNIEGSLTSESAQGCGGLENLHIDDVVPLLPRLLICGLPSLHCSDDIGFFPELLNIGVVEFHCGDSCGSGGNGCAKYISTRQKEGKADGNRTSKGGDVCGNTANAEHEYHDRFV